MITLTQAAEKVEAHLSQTLSGDDDAYCVTEVRVLPKAIGWVFFYNSTNYLETGDINHSIAGNAPIIIERVNGGLHLTGTSKPVEYYIKQFMIEHDYV